MDIYIVRHGQTDWNIAKKLQGREDIPLNTTGRQQALACAKALEGIPFETIYTSPLSRAAETAQIISVHGCHAPVVIEQDLTEREFGEGSGLTYDELHAVYPEYPEVLPRGMESFDRLSERIHSAVLRCMENHHEKPVLLVSHGGSINALLYRISGGSCGTGITWLKNTCISRLSLNAAGGSLKVDFYNLLPEEFTCLQSAGQSL